MPGIKPHEIHVVTSAIEKLQEEAATQLNRIAELQAQLDTGVKGRGPRGPKGNRGAPGMKPEEIDVLTSNIERLQDEATIQFRRIAQLQVQFDTTLKVLKQLRDLAGRQGEEASSKHRVQRGSPGRAH